MCKFKVTIFREQVRQTILQQKYKRHLQLLAVNSMSSIPHGCLGFFVHLQTPRNTSAVYSQLCFPSCSNPSAGQRVSAKALVIHLDGFAYMCIYVHTYCLQDVSGFLHFFCNFFCKDFTSFCNFLSINYDVSCLPHVIVKKHKILAIVLFIQFRYSYWNYQR